jgi:phage/plasmid primase-like uncharacterized protein
MRPAVLHSQQVAFLHGRQQGAIGDCPSCGYKNAFTVSERDGKKLFHCFAGCSQVDLLAAMRGRTEPFRNFPPPAQKDTTRIRDYALKLWQERQRGREGLVPVYLASRGLIGTVPASLGFLPDHLHKPSGTHWPVMVAAVTDCSGRVQAVHRTYLARDGKMKAPIEPAKMTLGAVGGLACHLAPAGEELIISEGIETGLSVQFATGRPTWAALSAGGMRDLILPPRPLASTVIIAADADPVGMQAAQDAAVRFVREGRRVRIAAPPTGTDFNDILQGAAA